MGAKRKNKLIVYLADEEKAQIGRAAAADGRGRERNGLEKDGKRTRTVKAYLSDKEYKPLKEAAGNKSLSAYVWAALPRFFHRSGRIGAAFCLKNCA